MTSILGISAFYHDSAATLVVDGEIAAAAEEERFSRKKHDSSFPTQAIRYCLEKGGIGPDDVDYVGFYDKPLLTFDRLIETYLSFAPRGFSSFLRAIPAWLKQKLRLPREIRAGMGRRRGRVLFANHHESHAASAFFPSPFDEAAILTFDGVGEWATAAIGVGRGNRIEMKEELRFPHSLGLLYSAFTYYTGFTVNSGEYKLMGLAPYGEPAYRDLILEHLIDRKEDGSFRLDMSYFNYCAGLTMTSEKFHRLFGGPPRSPDAKLTQRDMDLAASIQSVTEEIILAAGAHVHRLTGQRCLCLAGGVALNCVANGRLLREGPFEKIWIQPAAGDSGGSLGTALLIWHQLLGRERRPRPEDSQRGSLLGPAFSDEAIREFLDGIGATFRRIDDDGDLCEHIAEHLTRGKVVGWFQGPMEFGPRALGSRSILGDARSPGMQAIMNRKVKFREGFRPFAPAVLRERAHEHFEVPPGGDSPYMLLVADVREDKRRPLTVEEKAARGIDRRDIVRSEIPAVTHVDFSARIQTVDAERHGLYRRLLETFHRRTGCPVLVNTSFNLGWEPIVLTPRNAYETFMSCDIDVLCMGHHVLAKPDQRAWVPAEARDDPEAVLGPILSSPCCGADLARRDATWTCEACGHAFPAEDGIPRMYWPHETNAGRGDVTEAVKAFYEETPFPNYEEHDTLRSLIERSRRGGYAHLLDRAIPYNSLVLEVGCGTGQLSNFLGVACRRVIGADMCMNSLRLGERFRREHELGRVRFIQMNLFRPCLKPSLFDVILCNGVLHHTGDPLRGLEGLVPLLRPGGHIIVGLYSRYGRLMTGVRRAVFGLTGGRCQWLDPQLRSTRMGSDKRRAWFNDQYRHPHESKHTIGEVLGWFDRCGLEFIRGIPSVTAGDEDLSDGPLFAPKSRGSALDHLLVQLRHIVTGNSDNGYFLMIGRRPAAATAAGEMEPSQGVPEMATSR